MIVNKKQKKGVFITIIVLLIIFLPLSIVSFTLHKMDEKNPRHPVVDNPSHEFLYNGKLYFYNKNGSLLGTYECKNPNGICDYATSSNDDALYAVDVYPNEETKIPVVNDRYVFLVDGPDNTARPFVYDLVQNRTIISSYTSVKNYGIGIEHNLFIVGNNSLKYGVLSLEQDPYLSIEFEYDYIGLANLVNEEEEKLMSDFFVGYKDRFWFLLDMNGAVLTTAIADKIVSYNGQNIIIKTNDGYELINYQNEIVLPNGPYKKLSFTGRFLNILDNDNTFYVYDLADSVRISLPQTVRNSDRITSRINEDGKLEVVLNERVIETVEI